MKPFTVPGLLRAAASYIEIHGHEQRDGMEGGIGPERGPCCPAVAMTRIAPRVADDACNALRKRTTVRPLGAWSDRTPTAEVLATMRRVARELDAK